jgi:hypothetical protein
MKTKEEIKREVFKAVTVAMEVARDVDNRYPRRKDSFDLTEILNSVATKAVDDILIATEVETPW